MVRFLTILGFILSVSGCGVLSSYKPVIEQGNIYTKEDIQRLKIGMSKGQCAYILGNSILNPVYIHNRWDYVYTLKPRGSNTLYKKYAVLFFDVDDHLVKIIRSDQPNVLQSSDVPL